MACVKLLIAGVIYCEVLFAGIVNAQQHLRPGRLSKEEIIELEKPRILARFDEAKREPLPKMDLTAIVRDIWEHGMLYAENRYPTEVMNIIKTAYESFFDIRPYGWFEDIKGEAYVTSIGENDPRYYIKDIKKYGKIGTPLLVRSTRGKRGDVYQVPLFFRDTVKAYIRFSATTLKLLSMGYADRGDGPLIGLTNWPLVDSASASVIMQDAISKGRVVLSEGERIIDEDFFDIYGSAPYRAYLTNKGNVYLVNPYTREVE